MRAMVALCLSFSGLIAADDIPRTATLTFPANIAPVGVDNGFSRQNPDYKQGAGSYYEITYLPKATESLIARAALSNEQKPIAFEIIRAFIYDWLHLCVLDGGSITLQHRNEAVATMDNRFKQLLTSKQLDGYALWRNATKFDENALVFLIRYEPPSPDKDRDKKQP